MQKPRPTSPKRLPSPFAHLAAIVALAAATSAAAVLSAEPKWPVVFKEDFEHGADRWTPTDEKAWKVVETAGGRVYSLFQQSEYQPPHRSPVNFSLAKDVIVGDFALEARVRSTVKDYAHRDMCLIFGYQDPAHFYYVHLGKKTDDHANQIFIVNDAPRTKISEKTTPGTNWDDEWRRLKLVRTAADGSINVFWDDFERPIMTAVDKTFAWGQIGLGSFDDTGDWDDVVVRGVRVDRPRTRRK
ncbi:MAG TPA: hypothetical protein VMV10_19755 [Pirellulales bacterium]|nr:hypothetical protein [Pirellulales bacterium]